MKALSLFTMLAFFMNVLVAQQFSVETSVIGGGGAEISVGSLRIVSTAGQTLIGDIQSGVFRTQVGFWRPAQLLTPVEQQPLALPKEFALSQNFPNPFNPSTIVRFSLPFQSRVRLDVFDVMGREISTLVDKDLHPGFQQITWNANVPSGVYFYRIQAVAVGNPSRTFVDVKKMVLIR